MKPIVIWLGALLALGVLNFAIWQKESALDSGQTVYLELAPVDPRSLMQGDYMVLRYAIANEMGEAGLEPIAGRAILRIDPSGIGHFARLDDDQPLAPNERYLAYKNRRGPRFGIESFFFQEGKGSEYADAAYAKIRLGPEGTAILVDLVQPPR